MAVAPGRGNHIAGMTRSQINKLGDPRLYGVKVALDPTPTQARALASHAGAARFVFDQVAA